MRFEATGRDKQKTHHKGVSQTEDKVSTRYFVFFFVWKRRRKYGIIEVGKEG